MKCKQCGKPNKCRSCGNCSSCWSDRVTPQISALLDTKERIAELEVERERLLRYNVHLIEESATTATNNAALRNRISTLEKVAEEAEALEKNENYSILRKDIRNALREAGYLGEVK